MNENELMNEEVVETAEEIIPVSLSSGGGFAKKIASYGIAAIAGALIMEFGVKPLCKKVKTFIGKRKSDDFEYYDEPQEEE